MTFKALTSIIVLVIILCASSAWSQDNNSGKQKDYKKNPHWIKMMEDPAVNYFEAQKAFNEFWGDRKAPVEDDVIGANGEPEHKEEKTFLYKVFHARELKEEKETEEYRFEHKRFKHWMLMVEPFVQPDGRILSEEEQLEIWKTQRQ
jgi:hypothetical protein